MKLHEVQFFLIMHKVGRSQQGFTNFWQLHLEHEWGCIPQEVREFLCQPQKLYSKSEEHWCSRFPGLRPWLQGLRISVTVSLVRVKTSSAHEAALKPIYSPRLHRLKKPLPSLTSESSGATKASLTRSNSADP